MTTVAIFPVPSIDGGITYCAVSGGRQFKGRTAGEALDAISAQLPHDASGTLVVVQHLRPDGLFSTQQQERLEDLMGRWRAARDSGKTLAAAEQAELQNLVESELSAAGERAKSIALVSS